MLFSEISGLSARELLKMKKELRAALFDARMKNSMGQLGNPMVIRDTRKDIARINTALSGMGSGSHSTEAEGAPMGASSRASSEKAGGGAKKRASRAKATTAKNKTAPRGKKG